MKAVFTLLAFAGLALGWGDHYTTLTTYVTTTVCPVTSTKTEVCFPRDIFFLQKLTFPLGWFNRSYYNFDNVDDHSNWYYYGD